MHHFVTEMCINVHIFVIQWFIVGYATGDFWDLCNKFITRYVATCNMV